MRFRVLAGIATLAFLAVFSLPETAHAQLTRGAISGTVRDPSGSVVPGANLRLTNEDTGITRSAVTNTLGFYRIPALEPGRYRVLVEMPGFSKIEKKEVIVQMSLEATLNFDLKVSGATETLTVTGQAETISLNKSNPTVGLTSTGRQAVELPLSAGRNIDNLALLSPNVFTAPGSTGISANGNRARNNNFTIDGSDNNDISVTIRTTPVIPEAVGEFQVQTNAYNVEFGRNSGAQINVVTRSGTNSFRGELWDYYRSAGMNALDNIEKSNSLTEPTKFVRHQAGASLGGPIIRDKTFFFGLFQRDSNRTGETLGGTVRIPTRAGFQALQGVPLRSGQSQASRQAVLGAIGFLNDVYAKSPTFRSVQNVLVNGVNIETGQTNIGRVTPNTTPHVLGRVDHHISKNDSLTLRYVLNSPETENNNSNTNFGTLFAANTVVKDHNAALSEMHIFSAELLNEFRLSFIQRDLQFPEKDPKTPSTNITGLFQIGGLSNFPQGRTQKSWQFSDILTRTRGRHTIKLGADVRRIVLDNLSAFDSKGTYGFNNLQDYMNNVANTFQQAQQTSSFVAKQWQTFLFAQDDFRVNPDLVLNLGLRYELSTAPLGFFGATDSASLAVGVPGSVKKDTNNWAPRVGFAWSPRRSGAFFGDGKAVVRGGYGVSYDVLFYNILVVNASNYPRVVVPLLNNVVDVFPNVASVSGAAVFNPLATYVNSPEDLQSPKTHFYSASIQRELGRDFIVEVGYTGQTGRNGINQLQGNYAVLTPAQAQTVASTQNTLSIPNVQQRRLNPQIGSRVLIASTAKAQYHAGFLSLNKRMSHGLQFTFSYTLSRLMSDNDESLGVAAITTGSPQIPQDYARIQDEWSLSAFDRTHRAVASYIWEIPGLKSGVAKHVLGGWQLSGVTAFQSGQPFTVLTGVDSNGNGGGGDRPNLTGSGSFQYVDNRKGFKNDGYYAVPLGTNGLPLAFSLGNGNGLRNVHRAASFWNTDLSLLKRFELAGRHRLTLRIDALNVFNQDEYGLPVTSLSSPSVGQNTNNWGNRSITLGAKYSF